ncbi:MAG: hypothetical protein ABI598_03340 [Chloroflexota bacterium]
MVGRALLSRAAPGFTMPAFERLAPPPAPDLVIAHIEARTAPGDIVADLHGRGGWSARAAIDRQRRGLTLETSPLTRLLAEVVLRPPDLRHLDAAFSTLSASPKGDSSVKLAVSAPFSTDCETCGRNVVADEFMWTSAGATGDRSDPGARSAGVLAILTGKSYRCAVCRDQRGGSELRQGPVSDLDRVRASEDVGGAAARLALRDRFPVPDGAETLPEAILGLHTDRQLVGLQAILQRIEGDLRAAPVESALRLAFLHAVLPASRLGAGAGRVPVLRIAAGAVRTPIPHAVRERNPWLAFEDGFREVRAFVQRIESSAVGPLEARLGTDFRSLSDGGATAIVRVSSPDALSALARESIAGTAGREDARAPRIRLLLGQPPLRLNQERLAAAYHGTCWALGREAAGLLPLEALAGPAIRTPWTWQSAALRRSLEAAAPLMARDGRVVMLLEGGGPEGLAAVVLGGVGAGYRLADARLGDADDETGGIVELVPPGATVPPGARTRAGRTLDPEPGGSGDPAMVPGPGLFSPPERVEARSFSVVEAARTITDIAVEVLRGRGEPARYERLLGEILLGLDRAGHLRRLLVSPELDPDRSPAVDPIERVLGLIREELSGPGQHRLAEVAPGRWWLSARRDLEGAAVPLADRVEWAVYSLLSTAGPMDEPAFHERVAGMFTGHDLPDEALVRSCLESYRSADSTPDRLTTGDDVRRRTAEHTELLARLADGGHRLGMNVWIGRREQGRRFGSGTLGDLLEPHERTAWLPGIARAAGEDLLDVDCIWYVRGRTAFLFEVEWTAMLGEVLLRRHARIAADDRLVRFLAVAPERAELVRHKLAASPILRAAMGADNWHLVLWPHLTSWLSAEEINLAGLEPYLGLDPTIDARGQQLGLFPSPDSTP